MPEPSNKSPQIGVRFPKPEMERLRQHAEANYAGSVSTMVKVAVRRLIAAEQGSTPHDIEEQVEEVVAA